MHAQNLDRVSQSVLECYMSVQIRIAKSSEAQLVVDLASAFHLEDGHPLSLSGPAAISDLLKGSPLGEIYLVLEDGDVVGYFALCFTMSLEFGGLVVILDDFFIQPSARGRGLGASVLQQVELIAKQKNAVQIFLEVEHSNERAFSLYRKFGWKKRERYMMAKNL